MVSLSRVFLLSKKSMAWRVVLNKLSNCRINGLKVCLESMVSKKLMVWRFILNRLSNYWINGLKVFLQSIEIDGLKVYVELMETRSHEKHTATFLFAFDSIFNTSDFLPTSSHIILTHLKRNHFSASIMYLFSNSFSKFAISRVYLGSVYLFMYWLVSIYDLYHLCF